MPEESKKQKGKHEPKDQRRHGRQRHPARPVEQKPEKQPEVPKKQPEVSKEPEKPAYEPPGPEFYKSLKRETDEILKITEEANTKYKKKEIQSNWAKYEMPVESYEEIEEQENLGADYEKLIQAPASAGGHFQFKHEKSWDTENGPSVYDKYFNINMDLLSLALSTIPFYERNNIEPSIFNENDVLTMNHRATKFKQKYYNDKKYSTPELEAHDKILQKLTIHSDKVEVKNDDNAKSFGDDFLCEKPIDINKNVFAESATEIKVESPTKSSPEKLTEESKEVEEIKPDLPKQIEQTKDESKINVAVNETKSENVVKPHLTKELEEINFNTSNKEVDDKDDTMLDNKIVESRKNNIDNMKIKQEIEKSKQQEIVLPKVESPKEIKTVEAKPKVKEATPPKNPLIESPEDLEKWLDDFLDG